MTMDEDIEYYGDQTIASKDAKVPRWLKWSYPIIILWGFVWLFLYWNGAHGWIDRGYWYQLEQAANTTIPFENATED
jgi:hypothetical protein